MKLFAVLCASALFLAPSVHAAETYKIDPVHSTIGFKVRHLFAKVTGRFVDVTGTITTDPDHPENSSVVAKINTESITTENDKRDKDLRSPEFFDAQKFSLITFKSKKVHQLGPDTADVTGDLTMHGVTKEVTLHVKFLGKGKGMNGVTTGWEATTTIKRSEFGLTWNKVIEGTAVVGDEVDIELEIAADQQAP